MEIKKMVCEEEKNYLLIYFYLETMANWDDAQLAEVVERRHGEDNRRKNTTQIVRYKKEVECLP
jgi:hypothetical protein